VQPHRNGSEFIAIEALKPDQYRISQQTTQKLYTENYTAEADTYLVRLTLPQAQRVCRPNAI